MLYSLVSYWLIQRHLEFPSIYIRLTNKYKYMLTYFPLYMVLQSWLIPGPLCSALHLCLQGSSYHLCLICNSRAKLHCLFKFWNMYYNGETSVEFFMLPCPQGDLWALSVVADTVNYFTVPCGICKFPWPRPWGYC